MSMSREPKSLKKYSSDCLKLAKQWYSSTAFAWNDAIYELLLFLR